MFRWETILQPPICVCTDSPVGADKLPSKQHDPRNGIIVLEDDPNCSVVFQLSIADNALTIDAAISKAVQGLNKTLAPEWYYRDHIVVMLDPFNDHSTCWMTALTRDNETLSSYSMKIPGEMPAEIFSRSIKEPSSTPVTTVTETEYGWFGRIQISLPEQPSCAGLLLKACSSGPTWFSPESQPPSSLRWPETLAFALDEVPLVFGKLYPHPSSFTVTSLDFGKPCWGDNTLKIHANQPWDQTIVHVELPEDSKETFISGDPPSAVDFHLPFRGKWSPANKRIVRMHLDLRQNNRTIWKAAFPIGFDAGIITRDRFGAPPAPKPDPASSEFIDTYRRFILSRLPNLMLKTTQNGAPSDFTASDDQKKITFNLMDSDIYNQMADWITREFPDWRDALCAASILCHNPAVTVHSSSLSRLAGQLNSESILRIRGCFCDNDARVLNKLCTAIGRNLGQTFRGMRLGMRGHVALALETPDGLNVFDSMLGIFYYTKDNSRFATLEELIANRELSYRMSFDQMANGHEMFFQHSQITLQKFNEPELEFPGSGI